MRGYQCDCGIGVLCVLVSTVMILSAWADEADVTCTDAGLCVISPRSTASGNATGKTDAAGRQFRTSRTAER